MVSIYIFIKFTNMLSGVVYIKHICYYDYGCRKVKGCIALFLEKIRRPQRKSGLTPKTTKARIVRYVTHLIASMVFGVNLLFLGALHIMSYIDILRVIQ